MKLPLTLAVAFACSFALVVDAEDPSPISELRIKETGGHAFFCKKKEIKLAEMGEFAVEAITQIVEKATELRLMQGGPIMCTYFNFQGDPEQTFTAEFGVPMRKKDAAKADGLYVRETTKFKCASTIYQGPFTKIGDAWMAFVPTAMKKGEPSGESRELYLYWEGMDSPNTIIELQFGLK